MSKNQDWGVAVFLQVSSDNGEMYVDMVEFYKGDDHYNDWNFLDGTMDIPSTSEMSEPEFAIHVSKNLESVANMCLGFVCGTVETPCVQGMIYSYTSCEFYTTLQMPYQYYGYTEPKLFKDEHGRETLAIFDSDTPDITLDESETYVDMSRIDFDSQKIKEQLLSHLHDACQNIHKFHSCKTSKAGTHVISDEDYALLQKAKRLCS